MSTILKYPKIESQEECSSTAQDNSTVLDYPQSQLQLQSQLLSQSEAQLQSPQLQQTGQELLENLVKDLTLRIEEVESVRNAIKIAAQDINTITPTAFRINTV